MTAMRRFRKDPHDPQKHKVYSLEINYLRRDELKAGSLTPAEVVDTLTEVFDRHALGMDTLHLRFQRGLTHGRATHSGIDLPSQMNIALFTVLHEAAHMMVRVAEGHGPQFLAAYRQLLLEAGAMTRDAFDAAMLQMRPSQRPDVDETFELQGPPSSRTSIRRHGWRRTWSKYTPGERTAAVAYEPQAKRENVSSNYDGTWCVRVPRGMDWLYEIDKFDEMADEYYDYEPSLAAACHSVAAKWRAGKRAMDVDRAEMKALMQVASDVDMFAERASVRSAARQLRAAIHSSLLRSRVGAVARA